MQRKANGQFSSRDFTGFWLLTTSILIGALLKYTPKAQAESELANPYVSHDFNASPSAGLWREAEIVPLDQLSERLNTGSKTVEQPKTGKEQIVAYIYEVFGKDADNALKIAACESRMNPETVGDKHLMGMLDGEMVGDSIGLFQVRTGDAGVYDKRPWNRAKANGMTADEFRAKLKDPKYNIEYAKKMYDRQGWGQWHNCKNKTGV